MSLEKMAEDGLLERLTGMPEEIDDLLDSAHRHIRDAKLKGISPESRIVHSYQVILACATAALRANDFRAKNVEGKHVHTLESIKFTLGVGARNIKYFHSLRRKRHEDFYEGTFHCSSEEAEIAFKAAERILALAEDKLRG
jgi:hypothetical protein